ncbi:Elongation factor G-like protein [Frankia sp. AiPs1]|uniref:elongation factor G-like protein EF-G2 n=1 Tax=Frankia sp. AiPa1 TaxID=573492 RepID=UPI00202B210F|nr:elongation factor G-like protein EF-G2 [Frankia sp. AiPa1]MCL9758015.1 elongation factor G-like protein EF-G2 [Frankia sp. AiPa1]
MTVDSNEVRNADRDRTGRGRSPAGSTHDVPKRGIPKRDIPTRDAPARAATTPDVTAREVTRQDIAEPDATDQQAAARGPAIRNIALVGHSGAGKTALVDRLLAAAGPPERPGEHHAAHTSYIGHADPEHRQARSDGLTLCSVSHRGLTINLLDTPGHPDFVGELRAGLRAADAALFVVSAVDGVDATTRQLWAECAMVRMPRAIALTHLDHDRVDIDAATQECQRAFGPGALPAFLAVRVRAVQEPNGAEAAGAGAGTASAGAGTASAGTETASGIRLTDLLHDRIAEYTAAGDRQELPAGPRRDRQEPPVEAARAALVEGIIAESEDEALLEQYLSGADPDADLLAADLATAVARADFFPVLPTGTLSAAGGFSKMAATSRAAGGFGSLELLDLFATGFPAPSEHPLGSLCRPDGSPHPARSGDPAAPLVAEVVRTTSDPYVGRMSVVRVFSGTLRPDDTVRVRGRGRAQAGHDDHDDDERVGALSRPYGCALHSVSECPAGGICVVTKLMTAETGDTLSGRGDPCHLPVWTMPEPQLPVAVRAHARTDEDRLSTALSRLCLEDPSLRVVQDPQTAQIVLWSMGEAHAEAVLARLATRYGAAVDTEPAVIPLRETVAAPAHGTGRQVKQSGGHGQFAVCQIEVEPLPPGGGFEFVDEVVGGAIPRAFIPSVEKGIRAQMAAGVRPGHPLTDLRVRLVDGRAHSVDSSDLAFQVAGGLALRDAMRTGGVVVLEPVLTVDVSIPDEFVGAVLGDLSARRGRVVGMEPQALPPAEPDTGRTLVHAEVPEREMSRYVMELRSLSHGTGQFHREPHGYEPMPDHLAHARSD